MRTREIVYDQLLTLQADASFEDESDLVTSREQWASAKRILDLGAGNGAYGARLAVRYPDKEFTGVEPDGDLIAIAVARGLPENYRLLTGHLSVVEDQRFDVLLARLVLMYVSDRRHIASWARQHINSYAVVFDSDDSAFSVTPDVPIFQSILATRIRTRADQLGGKRDLTTVTLQEWVSAGMVHDESRSYIVSSDSPRGRLMMHHLMLLNAELAAPDLVSEELRREIFEWSLSNDARLQYGIVGHRFLV